MASNSGLTLVGLENVTGNLRRLMLGTKKETRRAMHEEANAIKTASMKRTPVEFGTLRASHTFRTKILADDVVATISVGGPAASYAVHVHENLKARHPVGEAKFLEKSINERRPIAEKLAARIDLNRAGRG